ncbi:DUF6292 family protein [Actinokineospora sp. UTMC 2448]|uniref:DUF6292 family protein n=1 Tax=Actinokineospora sp. UTMC 2448 TaxID=2268449 RepID=UPI002164463D|nr:DUF6292 family protein [Actinokineospora sp. UTMC 2448]UVS81421.1 hypothetical protein Actkin_05178 [Actinokineospora sp. UTMC 2448]
MIPTLSAEAIEQGLRGYLAAVGDRLGIGLESCAVDLGPPLSAYLAVDQRLPDHPDRDAALLWDERHGWSVAVETHSGEDLIVVGYLGPDPLPRPDAVARFLRDAARGARCRTDPPDADPDALDRLVDYRAVALT